MWLQKNTKWLQKCLNFLMRSDKTTFVMKNVSIYNYENPRQFLLDFQSEAKLSVRALAKQMGMRSHTLLVMLLKGKRAIRMKHAAIIAKGTGLSSQEKLYLQALIQYANADDHEAKQLNAMWLAELHPHKEFKVKEIDDFIVISHWVHMAILAMSELKNSPLTPTKIAKRLGGKVTAHEVRAAVERLKTGGLLVEDSTGKLSATYQKVTTSDDVKNAGAKAYHKQVSELAAKAVEDLPLAEREFQAFAMSVSKDKIPMAKEMIRKFRAQFAKAIGADETGGDEVFQMNIQFFQLTESQPETARQMALTLTTNQNRKEKENENHNN